MKIGIYKEVHIDTSHRLLHYFGKCANLHGHRWKVEVWIEGEPDPATQILIDYSLISQVINKYDHQIILNREDPMVSRIEEFHPVITTPGDPTSELMAVIIRDDLYAACRELGIKVTITKIRVWESPTACAELTEYEAKAALATAAATLRQAQFDVAVATDAQGVYRLRAEDTLGIVAGRFYGTGNRWPLVYEANRHVLANPDALVPGITLVVP